MANKTCRKHFKGQTGRSAAHIHYPMNGYL
jgi:hypothetical protein